MTPLTDEQHELLRDWVANNYDMQLAVREAAHATLLLDAEVRTHLNAAAHSATASTPPPAAGEVERDAARYRFLKLRAPPGSPCDLHAKMAEAKHLLEAYEMFCSPWTGWDAAIDAAIDALRTPPPQEGGNHGAEVSAEQSSAPADTDICSPRVLRGDIPLNLQTNPALLAALKSAAAPQSEATDTARLDWLAERLFAADFESGFSGVDGVALIFAWPTNVGVGPHLRANIDAAMQGNTDKT